MFTRENLKDLVIEALRVHSGKARVLDICKYIWDHHEAELRNSGNLLYTWQYDIRWAAQRLRDEGILKPVYGKKTMPWELA
jgi:hypothetical protein